MPRRNTELRGYGDVFGVFIRQYINNIHPQLKKGNFDVAAGYMEQVRGDYSELGEGRRRAGVKVAKAYKGAMKEILGVLEMSCEEARVLFDNPEKRKTLLRKISKQVRIMDNNLVSRTKKNEDYLKHRKAFEKRLPFI